MLFFPQGYKSGKMLSGSGSTPMRSASLSARIQQLWGEPMNPVRLLWTGQLSRTFPSGFAVLSAGNGTSKKATAGLALFVLIDVMDCINVTQRTDITRGGGCWGCCIRFFLLLPHFQNDVAAQAFEGTHISAPRAGGWRWPPKPSLLLWPRLELCLQTAVLSG